MFEFRKGLPAQVAIKKNMSSVKLNSGDSTKKKDRVKKEKDRIKSKNLSGTGVKTSKPTKEAVRKLYRICIRKLPVGDFSEQEFNKCIDRVCVALDLSRENFSTEHFIPGKIR